MALIESWTLGKWDTIKTGPVCCFPWCLRFRTTRAAFEPTEIRPLIAQLGVPREDKRPRIIRGSIEERGGEIVWEGANNRLAHPAAQSHHSPQPNHNYNHPDDTLVLLVGANPLMRRANLFFYTSPTIMSIYCLWNLTSWRQDC